MARRDEMIFRLLALRLRFKTLVRNVPEHDGMWVFTPNSYRDRSKEKRK
jgi:type IV secretion system protein VirB3